MQKKVRNGRPAFAAWRSNFSHDMLLHVHKFSAKPSDSVKYWVLGLPEFLGSVCK
jgi:hypothetical protein